MQLVIMHRNADFSEHGKLSLLSFALASESISKIIYIYIGNFYIIITSSTGIDAVLIMVDV